jgi:heat shock protein HslJ
MSIRWNGAAWTAVLLVSAAALLGACGSDDPSSEPAGGTTGGSDGGTTGGSDGGNPPDVDGREFVSTEVEGHQLVEGSTIRLTFQDGNVSANAGCNTMSGGYTFEGDVLRVELLATTEMACPDPLMDQDAFVSGLLTSGPTVTVDGDTLTLTSGEETITMLDREVAEPDLPLEGTSWVLDGIVANEAISSVPVGVEASLLIEDGQASIATGCNNGSTSVEVTDQTLTFGPIATTMMLCEDDANQTQDAVLATLDGEVDYAIESDRLSISNPNGRGLEYRAAE